MHLEYWGLKKQPFNNVPDPEMYFDRHQSVGTAVREVRCAIDEGDAVLAVVIGPAGAGKTMSIRIVLDSIDKSKYNIAFVTNPDMTAPQLLREIIGQLKGEACEERLKDALLEEFSRLLTETSDQGKRTLIFIDEGHVIKAHNLDNIQMLTNMQDDTQNLFTIILAGQPELGKHLEDPKRANLFQRIGVYCRIEGIDSSATMQDYIKHRLVCAGNPPEKEIFTDGATQALWKISEDGIPRIINKICKLAMKTAETSKLDQIDENIIQAVGSRFARSYSTPKQATPSNIPEVQSLADHPFKHFSKENASADDATEILKDKLVPQEIAPTDEDTEKCIPEFEQTYHVMHKREKLSGQDLEDLASRLATQRVETMSQVSDPFEAWETARADILQQIKKSNMASTNKEA